MHPWLSATLLCFLAGVRGCHTMPAAQAPAVQTPEAQAQPMGKATLPADGRFVGFDRNDYPGDAPLAELHRSFAFLGYWLTPPPGEKTTGWLGKRVLIRQSGFGFLLLADGRLYAEIKRSMHGPNGLTPEEQGRVDGKAAASAAQQEGFPAGATLFLDQEEGGRLLPEQLAYFFGWTEAVAASAYKPGAYLSGQRSPDGDGPDGKPSFITTAQDVQQQVAKRHLHPVALWVYDDTCPPAPGCTLTAPPLNRSGTPEAMVWQYAQSPRRPESTAGCAKTYAPDSQCYAGVSTDLVLDLNVAASADPSHGR